MKTVNIPDILPPPIVVNCRDTALEELLSREWLLTNRIGAFASGTAAGCNTRRYHGLLVSAADPPAGRLTALSTVMESLIVGETTFKLATNEFANAFSPGSAEMLVEFRNDAAATFVYRVGELTLTKEVLLAETANSVTIRYTLRGGEAWLKLAPFVALRDYHHLRQFDPGGGMSFHLSGNAVAVQDTAGRGRVIYLLGGRGVFTVDPDWWYRFHYRADHARGQDSYEDLYTPGWFGYELGDLPAGPGSAGQAGGEHCEFTACLDEASRFDFDATAARRRERSAALAAAVGDRADETDRRLAAATDAFVVQRSFPSAPRSATILAGYHWFADWGRDAFIALPGLLLSTGRFDRARDVFHTFADHLSEGMIPSRFDDYSASPHYNSIDASLWFAIAAERYLRASGDRVFWRDFLMPVCDTILRAYREGTRFDIHADADGLLAGGSRQTQLTWMDAALGDEVVTPRHGKAVEVNALWYSAHRMMAERCAGADDAAAQRYAHLADLIAPAFSETFWNEQCSCLYDCVNDGEPDASIRPNQIFAVSLPHSPLSDDRQARVLRVVTEHLLTPRGLRTLSPADPRYRRCYGGSWQSRDRAYHQGTVWAWLIGPFIEAHLKVHADKPLAVRQAAQWLEPFDEHLREAGLGYVSEIFDAEPPHQPRGCIAQAWSVAELLRARMLVHEYEAHPAT